MNIKRTSSNPLLAIWHPYLCMPYTHMDHMDMLRASATRRSLTENMAQEAAGTPEHCQHHLQIMDSQWRHIWYFN